MASYFRICRTLLKNVAQHARATRASIDFHVLGQTLCLKIEDNGCGFTVPADWESHKRQKHYGMYMANYFAESIGGKLQVASTPGGGTRITVTSPLHYEAA